MTRHPKLPGHPARQAMPGCHRSLLALDNDLHKLGSRLILREGDSLQSLRQLVSETGATHVYWNRRYEPGIMQRDAAIKESLKEQGIQVRSFNGSLLAEPWQIQNQAGNPFQVFTPYWRHHRLKILVTSPLPTPSPAVFCKQFDTLPSRLLDDLKLTPSIHWDRGFWQRFTPRRIRCPSHTETIRESRDSPAIRNRSRSPRPTPDFETFAPPAFWRNFSTPDPACDQRSRSGNRP